ncbi:hypothetical protein HMPREF3208_00412 [Gardnerella vaginalis]|uniref:Uncharacterized protein n=1 Tax=Gardnerella vaginalis TaxID=2702 RepID=A0A133P0V0_GARVA|nr:hypothetical protein HMPREF3208_00412 [Gardnerella vaginalis]
MKMFNLNHAIPYRLFCALCNILALRIKLRTKLRIKLRIKLCYVLSYILYAYYAGVYAFMYLCTHALTKIMPQSALEITRIYGIIWLHGKY